MPVPSTIDQLSTTAASNFPAGSDSPSSLDDVQRAHGSFIATIRDTVGLGTGTLVPATARTNFGAAASGPLASSGITGAAASGANTDITSLASPAIAAATATTQAGTDSTTKVATTAMVQAALSQSGKVLQTVISQDAGSSTSSTSLTNLSAGLQTITPKSTASQIFVRCSFMANIPPLAATNVQGAFQLYDSTNATLIGYNVTFGPTSGGGNVGMSANQTIEYFVSNAALTSRSFTLRGNTGNASVAFSATQCVWTLTEVAN